MATGQLLEHKAAAGAREEETPFVPITTLLEDRPWVADSLTISPDSVTALRFTSPLTGEGPAGSRITAPLPDGDQLFADQFDQLREDLVFTLGEMTASARQSALEVWSELVVRPLTVGADFLGWLGWQGITALALALGAVWRFSWRALRFAGAVVLDFILLVMELLDGEVHGAVAPTSTRLPDIPAAPPLEDMDRAGIRFLDRRGFPFLVRNGGVDNRDFQLKRALEDIRRMARFAVNLPVPTAGPFSGMKMSDVLLTVTADDLHAFFRHLLSRREEFRGRTLKLAETYTLWALEGAPRPEAPARGKRGR